MGAFFWCKEHDLVGSIAVVGNCFALVVIDAFFWFKEHNVASSIDTGW